MQCIGFARFHDDMSTLSKADRFACEVSLIMENSWALFTILFYLQKDEHHTRLPAASKSNDF